MHFTPHEIYHVYNKGNNSQRIFFAERNYGFFLSKTQKQLSPVCHILSWCLMPNHFHFLIYATERSCTERPSFGGKPMQEFAYQLGMLLSSYSQAINKQNGTTGSLFQQKTKAKCVSSETNSYVITCMHYIHQNPLRAGLVNTIEDWEFSSFHEYIGGGENAICDCDLLLSLSGYDVRTFYEDSYGAIDKDVKELFK